MASNRSGNSFSHFVLNICLVIQIVIGAPEKAKFHILVSICGQGEAISSALRMLNQQYEFNNDYIYSMITPTRAQSLVVHNTSKASRLCVLTPSPAVILSLFNKSARPKQSSKS